MIILDAYVLIAFLDESDTHHDRAVDLLERRFFDGFAASVLTVAEALFHPARVDRDTEARDALAAIGVRILPIEASDAPLLAHVRNNSRVRMPDAVALHTAASTGSELATFDESLIAAAESAGLAVAR